MSPKDQGLQDVEGLSAVHSVIDCPFEDCTVN